MQGREAEVQGHEAEVHRLKAELQKHEAELQRRANEQQVGCSHTFHDAKLAVAAMVFVQRPRSCCPPVACPLRRLQRAAPHPSRWALGRAPSICLRFGVPTRSTHI